MKKLFYFLILVVLNVQLIDAQVPTSGLVGYWPFNGNANDQSGNNLNGTVNGATLKADRFGNANNAYYFNGTTDNISIGNNSLLNFATTNKFSLSYWMTPATLESTRSSNIMNKQTGHGATQKGWNSFVFLSYSSYLGISNSVNGCEFYTDASTISTNQLYHIVQIYENGIAYIYINGILSKQVNCVTSIADNTSELLIGKPSWTYSNVKGFNGVIDDIRIYNRALNQSEVSSLFYENLCSTSKPQAKDVTRCESGQVTLTATGGATYRWYDSLNGGNLLNTGTTYTTPSLSTTTTYYVANFDGTCESLRFPVKAIINQLPTVSIGSIPGFINIYSKPIILTGLPSGGIFSGDGVTGSSFNPLVAGLGVAKLTYSYSNGIGCNVSASINTIVYDTTGVYCSRTDTLVINVKLTGINIALKVSKIKIYPNPAFSHIYIENQDYTGMSGYSIKIDNSLGQTVFTSPINQQKFYIDLSGWKGRGIYFVHIIDPNNAIIDIRKLILK